MVKNAVVAGNAVLIAAVLGWSTLAPTGSDHVVVAVAPWSEDGVAERVVAIAGGRIIDSHGTTVVAASEDTDFVARLYSSGAMLVLDARQAAGCAAR